MRRAIAYDGRLLAAFCAKNEYLSSVWCEASTKAIGKSVDRNRASVCYANSFARSAADLKGLQQTYDWFECETLAARLRRGTSLSRVS